MYYFSFQTLESSLLLLFKTGFRKFLALKCLLPAGLGRLEKVGELVYYIMTLYNDVNYSNASQNGAYASLLL